MKTLRFLTGLFIYALTISVVLTAGALWWGSNEFQKPGPLEEPLFFEVESGASSRRIAELLLYEGALDLKYNYHAFIYGTRFLGQQGNLKAGEYELRPGMSAQEIMELLTSGKTFQRQFTIREGLTSYEVVNLLSTVPDLTQKEASLPVEGVLLPETYSYQKGETTAQI